MTCGLLKEFGSVHHRAPLGIIRCKNQPLNTRKRHGARAHGARLQRHIEPGPHEALILEPLCCLPDDQDFRVRRGVLELENAVATARHHLFAHHKDRAHRHFTPRGGGGGFFKGQLHKLLVHNAGACMRLPTRARAAAMTDPFPENAERIAKYMARAGIASRRECERLIEQGIVTVDGKVLSTPAFKVTGAEDIRVDGTRVGTKERTRLFRYHKPQGLVTSHSDEKGRRTVFEALPPGLPRLISVGRLDLNTEGLLLLTNDGELARHLELPSTGWLRRYRVRVYGYVTQSRLDKLKNGIEVEGIRYGAITAKLDSTKGHNSWLTLSFREGKNREIRRVMEALDLTVNRLIRLSYGPFQMGALKEGEVEEVPGKMMGELLGAKWVKP